MPLGDYSVSQSEKNSFRKDVTDKVPSENRRAPLELLEQFYPRGAEPPSQLRYQVRPSEFKIKLNTHGASILG